VLALMAASAAAAGTEEAPRADVEPGIVVAPADQVDAEAAAPAATAPAVGQSPVIVTILPPERPAPTLKLVTARRPAAPTASAPTAPVEPAPAAPAVPVVSSPPPAPVTPAPPAATAARADVAATSTRPTAIATRREAAPAARAAGQKSPTPAAAPPRPAARAPSPPAVARQVVSQKTTTAKPKHHVAATRPAAPQPRFEAVAPAVVVAPETIDAALLLALGAGLVLMLASTLPQAVAWNRPRWVEQGQVAVGGLGLACALGSFAVLLAAA
jgi:hypothetical protein